MSQTTMPGKVDAVGFIIKSMVERDPSKRRVKPSLQALEDFDGVPLEDSSDDSDYEVRSEDHDMDSAASNVSCSSSSSSSSSSDSEEQDDDDDDFGDTPQLAKQQSGKISTVTKPAEITTLNHAELDASTAGVKVCCVCLSDVNTSHNEVIECDQCHITVHEDCYGVCESVDDNDNDGNDVERVSSSAGNVELWFCEACRVDDTEKQCELCPSSGGVLKQTDTGRWVHLVCALYVPGVAFIDVEKLERVTLFELTYSRWGAKQCQLCDNPLFSRTGVTLQCDAGMCKVAFHATCAQRFGLLEEVRQTECGSSPNVADPYFAHCRAHVDKSAMRLRKRNYLAIQHRLRVIEGVASRVGRHQDAIRLRLARARASHAASEAARSPSWRPTMKLGRPVASSVLLARMLLRRTELLGTDLTANAALSASDELTGSSSATGGGVGASLGGRKWLLPPAFSAEFVSYFCERRGRIESDRKRLVELQKEQNALAQRRARLESSQTSIEHSLTTVRQMAALLHNETTALYSALSRVSGKQLNLPALAQTVTPSSGGVENQQSTELSVCGECSELADIRLCAVCDECGHCFHLQCLKPPLLRIPQRCRNSVWQCWRCSKLSIDERENSPSAGDEYELVSGKRQRAPPKLFQIDAPTQRRRRKRFSRRAHSPGGDITEEVPRSNPAADKSPEPTPVADDKTPLHAKRAIVSGESESTSPRRARIPRRIYSPSPHHSRNNTQHSAASSLRRDANLAAENCDTQMALTSTNDGDRPSNISPSQRRYSTTHNESMCDKGLSPEWSDGEGLSGDSDVPRRAVKGGVKRARRGRPRLVHGRDRQWFPTSQWAPQKRKRRAPVPPVHLELQQKGEGD